jgi:hypothetical protein
MYFSPRKWQRYGSQGKEKVLTFVLDEIYKARIYESSQAARNDLPPGLPPGLPPDTQ